MASVYFSSSLQALELSQRPPVLFHHSCHPLYNIVLNYVCVILSFSLACWQGVSHANPFFWGDGDTSPIAVPCEVPDKTEHRSPHAPTMESQTSETSTRTQAPEMLLGK